MDKLLVPSTPGPNPRITLLLTVPQPQDVSSLKRPSTCSSQQFMTDKYEPVSSVFYAVSLCQTPASLPWVGHAYDEKRLGANGVLSGVRLFLGLVWESLGRVDYMKTAMKIDSLGNYEPQSLPYILFALHPSATF
nr:hypothetical protein L204_05127 [Cryptococcus depauperatus CBS 7855]